MAQLSREDFAATVYLAVELLIYFAWNGISVGATALIAQYFGWENIEMRSVMQGMRWY